MKPQSTEPPRTLPASEARALLEEQRQSGLSIAAFARERNVKPWVLYNAQASARRRAARARGRRFAEVQVVGERPSPAAASDSAIELALPSGVAIRVRRDFDEVALRRLLGVLGSC